MKLSLEKGGEGADLVLIFVFVSRYPNLFQLPINQINFPQVKFVLAVMVTGKQSPCL